MASNPVFAGSLHFFNLGDLLQLIGANGATGVLYIRSVYAKEPGLVYIVKGNPINALCDSRSGLDALLSLFGWVDGEFEFVDEAVTASKVITKNRMEIVLDGFRMLDDGKIPKLGPVSRQAAGPNGKAERVVIRGPLIDYMDVVDEEEFENGKEIMIEKAHGSWIWVIMEGMVDIFKETQEGKVKIITLADGSFLGSIQSFSLDGNIRGSTAIAVGKVHLGVLDSRRLAAEFSSFPQEFKNFFFSMDRRLREISGRALDYYLKKNIRKSFGSDEKPVIMQGETDAGLYAIAEGEAFVVRKTDFGDILLARLKKGDIFGSIPFINLGHEPHYASILPVTKIVETIPIDPESLQKQYDRLSTTFRNFLVNLSTCVSATTSVACEFFKNAIQGK